MRGITRVVVGMALALWVLGTPAWAEDARDKEITEIKARLERLERERQAEQGAANGAQQGTKEEAKDKPEGGPLSCLKVCGGITGTAQGTVGNSPGDHSGANFRADLLLSASPTCADQIGLHFLMSRGSGVNNAPGSRPGAGRFEDTFLGNPNANIQYNSDIPHLVEAWYQHCFADGRLVATLGILDPTVYFDTNRFANDETLQFMGTVFVNNPGIDWGGDANFYGPGVRLTASPAEWLDLSLGGFATQSVPTDNDEVVGFENEFDKPFGILEANFKVKPWGREGNWRLYAWYNANKTAFTRFDNGEEEASWGGGGSFDQDITENLGAFLRWSKQDESIRRLDWHVSGGLSAKGLVPGRACDVAGIGYAIGMTSSEFEGSDDCLGSGTEHWIEAYYSMKLGESFTLSPDVQYIINPCGERDDIFVWGLRALAVF